MGTRSIGKPRLAGSPGVALSNGTANPVLVDLKQRTLAAITKLEDRDTQQIAVQELERIAENAEPEGIPVMLHCLYDTDAQQKSSARRECVRLFGVLAAHHGDLLTPHLVRIISTTVRRLRDVDSGTRDACAEALGLLAAHVTPPGHPQSPEKGGKGSQSHTPGAAGEHAALGVFLRPLFEALGEQHRSVQQGAAAALGRVLLCSRMPLAGSLPRIASRLVKCLGSPSFQAKAQLTLAVGCLAEAAGSALLPYLAVLLPPLRDALESPSDWLLRKSAAEALTQVAVSLGPAAGEQRDLVVGALEAARFDKVKPVRESVVEAARIWKDIPAISHPTVSTPPPPQGKSTAHRDSHRDSNASAVDEPLEATPKTAMRSREGSLSMTLEDGSESGGPSTARRRRKPSIGERIKSNPEFFKQIEHLEGWQVEISTAPPPGPSPVPAPAPPTRSVPLPHPPPPPPPVSQMAQPETERTPP